MALLVPSRSKGPARAKHRPREYHYRELCFHGPTLPAPSMRDELVIDQRYRGFADVALGGYVGGLLAGAASRAAPTTCPAMGYGSFRARSRRGARGRPVGAGCLACRS